MTEYHKQCKGCGKPFTSNARGARFGPPDVCSCSTKRAKHRAKRARERRQYRKNPEQHRALSRTRAQARAMVLSYHGIIIKDKRVILSDDNPNYQHLGCNSPGCTHQFQQYHDLELQRRRDAGQSNRGSRHNAILALCRKLEAHHRDHDPFNNVIGSNYPITSNIELLCRHHHEQADRGKTNHASMIVWTPTP